MKNSRAQTIGAIITLLVIVVIGYFISQRDASMVRNPLGEYALYDTTMVEFRGREYTSYVVDTERLRSRGLSNKSSLPEDEGMLFVFDESDIHSFWMKDMNFDIDIIWINENGSVVYIVQNASPESYPEFFTPTQESMYVWEVNAGFAAENGIDIGGRIEIDL
jgi:uncharacterized membrane protein (UPF0127 family)